MLRRETVDERTEADSLDDPANSEPVPLPHRSLLPAPAVRVMRKVPADEYVSPRMYASGRGVNVTWKGTTA